MSPIDGKVRIVGTAELAKVGAPANYQRAKRLIPLTQNLLPGLDASGGQEWMGEQVILLADFATTVPKGGAWFSFRNPIILTKGTHHG